ncbi:hypothetical protein T265_03378 [Opisthorchis viverrini]|uniref:Sm domain-containing protein n=1 Tax=Opisthorchis viverrini TaxID=6198 RepID=A0A074ZW48_OPIVI|nr:hypothetical protein T265_03378 [Opisthorchis viverrini]KER30112.1 hypothetical protein T265_03378 [Opisthorchis viverrini]
MPTCAFASPATTTTSAFSSPQQGIHDVVELVFDGIGATVSWDVGVPDKQTLSTSFTDVARDDYQQVSSQSRMLPPGDSGRYQYLHIPLQQPLDHQRRGGIAQWLEREFTDRKVRGSNPTSAPRLPLFRLGQPGSIPALLIPSTKDDGTPAIVDHVDLHIKRTFWTVLFFSFFRTLVGKDVLIELKNDLCICGTLHSVDQYHNFRLTDISVTDPEKHPHMVCCSILLTFTYTSPSPVHMTICHMSWSKLLMPRGLEYLHVICVTEPMVFLRNSSDRLLIFADRCITLETQLL